LKVVCTERASDDQAAATGGEAAGRDSQNQRPAKFRGVMEHWPVAVLLGD
jgi:hypothetical protein